ncbi:hypothetical protein O7602_24345 [Micromonospora sp. WMMD1128]|uniref:hypothetical protein n=1 Tax=Micromonospora sp. WMMD1128 TaxID=3015150 RepID=UPI00248BF8C3|nr:hypothetical protein [Micromonospora sp. WMMD1128]WBB72799.1 hypothetical protein O7602_24345 [Micromonospora sp. WMMD1128]
MDDEPELRTRDWLPRTAALVLGTLALASAFIAAYVGALHKPDPKDVPVAVVTTDQQAQAVMSAVRARTDTIKPVGYDSQERAVGGLHDRSVYAVLHSDPGGGLTLATASAGAPAATELVTDVFTEAARQADVPLQVTDEVPVSGGDPRGLVPFYLAVGVVLGGYLASTALGISLGTSPRDLRRAGLRIATLAVHSILLGMIGAILVGPVLDVFGHNVPAIAVIGALAAFAAGMVAAAVQAWLGLLGTGIVILLLVVLGNPGSGGIYAPEFLPPFLRGMHRWNVPGLATDLFKSAVYFDWRGGGWALTGLLVWVVAGLVGLLTATMFRARRRATRTAPGRHAAGARRAEG